MESWTPLLFRPAGRLKVLMVCTGGLRQLALPPGGTYSLRQGSSLQSHHGSVTATVLGVQADVDPDASFVFHPAKAPARLSWGGAQVCRQRRFRGEAVRLATTQCTMFAGEHRVHWTRSGKMRVVV